jgi:hypothetical protein
VFFVESPLVIGQSAEQMIVEPAFDIGLRPIIGLGEPEPSIVSVEIAECLLPHPLEISKKE